MERDNAKKKIRPKKKGTMKAKQLQGKKPDNLNLMNSKITEERRNVIRKFLKRQSAKTGRHWADLLAQSLYTDEVRFGLLCTLEIGYKLDLLYFISLEKCTPSNFGGEIDAL